MQREIIPDGYGEGCLVEMCEEPLDEREQTEEPLTTEEGATEISLQSLAGTFNPRTLRLKGTIKGRELTVLIDSGSTHNFIQNSVAYRLGIGLQSLQEFKVFIGSGEYLVCREVCRQVPMTTRSDRERGPIRAGHGRGQSGIRDTVAGETRGSDV